MMKRFLQNLKSICGSVLVFDSDAVVNDSQKCGEANQQIQGVPTKPSRKRSRSPVKDLLSVLPMGVLSFIFRPDGTGSDPWEPYANREFRAMTGATADELETGAWIDRVVHKDDRHRVYTMLGYRWHGPIMPLAPSRLLGTMSSSLSSSSSSSSSSYSLESSPPPPVPTPMRGVRFEYRIAVPPNHGTWNGLRDDGAIDGFSMLALNANVHASTHREGGNDGYMWVGAENASLSNNASETIVVHTIMDITSLKAAERERMMYVRATEHFQVEKAREAKRRREEIEEFVDVMCHELRNPLNGIAGNVDLLKCGLEVREDILLELEQSGTVSSDRITKLRQQLRDDEESIAAIHACAEHSRMVADDVLELGKLEECLRQQQQPYTSTSSSAIPPTRQLPPFDPKVVLSEVARMLGARASLKGLGIRLNFPLEDVVCVGDQQKIRQIVVNLVSNAIVHCDRGSITVTLDVAPDAESLYDLLPAAHPSTGLGKTFTTDEFTLGKPAEVSQLQTNATLRISVIDTGVGLTPEEIASPPSTASTPVLRHPAYPASSGTTGGSGLGLLICKRLVESMGGNMSVESTKGKGARFSFTVRIVLLDPSSEPVLAAEPVGNPFACEGGLFGASEQHYQGRVTFPEMGTQSRGSASTASSGTARGSSVTAERGGETMKGVEPYGITLREGGRVVM
ncbi:hypothetical protein BC829DRAFT_385774 [Chytridium lagenaria]|nr:hypothetical protein BC829DRAFT_385774 [Chytridium lagenaria]